MQNYTQLFSVYKWSYDAVSGSRERTGLLKEMLAQVIISVHSTLEARVCCFVAMDK